MRSAVWFPGGVVAIGRRDAAGASRVDCISAPGAPEVDGDTLFEIGSLTKPITALILASMVRTGDVALETAVGDLLPEGVAPLRHGERAVTLLDLATHTSGLPRLPPNLGWTALIGSDPYRAYNRGKLFSLLDRYRLRHVPGERFEYSNLGFGLLGTLLADRAGMSFAQLARERVFAPLGMTSSRADYRDDFRLIAGHTARGAAAPPWHLGTLEGAGAVRSSVNDMLRFAALHVASADDPLASDARLTQTPRRPAFGAQHIGLAWLRTPRGIVWHNGGTGGYRSFLGFDPARRTAVAVLANAAVDAVDGIGMELLDDGRAAVDVPVH